MTVSLCNYWATLIYIQQFALIVSERKMTLMTTGAMQTAKYKSLRVQRQVNEDKDR